MSKVAAWASNENYVGRIVGGEPWELLKRDTSFRFHDLMNNAMLVSAYKYGAVEDAYPEKVNALSSAQLRITKYVETGNVEYLVDAANLLMIEFMCPAHGNAHYKATDADGSPGRVAHNEVYDKPTQAKNSDLLEANEKF